MLKPSPVRTIGAPGPHPEPLLAVVVVNFRTPALTIDCLRSLEPEAAAVADCRVIVVDNGSGDGSADALDTAIMTNGWGTWVRLVRSDRNGGFSFGNNRGIEAAGAAKYFLLLNSDTIVHPGCLRRCVEIMEKDPTIGAMSCKLLNADGSIQNVARRFPTPARTIAGALGLPWRWPRLFEWADCDDLGWDRGRTARDVDWIGGAFLLTRGEVLRRIGGLDERFFFYGEDIEFCHRVRRAGLRCRYDPSATTTHLGGSSSDPARMAARARSVHVWRARYLVQRLCYGRLAAAGVRAVDWIVHATKVSLLRLAGRGGSERCRQLADVLALLSRRLGARS